MEQLNLNPENREDITKIYKTFIGRVLNSKDKNEIKELCNYINKNDILLKMYKYESYIIKRNIYRFQCVITNCIQYLNISNLVKILIKDENITLLDIIFNNLQFFNIENIIQLLYYYKNRTAISSSDFNQQIGKFKFLTDTEYSDNSVGKYLINECTKKDINICLIKYLVEHGIKLNYKNKKGEPALYIVCKSDNEKIIKYLVEHGADTNAKNEKDCTPLFIACENGNESVVKYLVEHGAHINKENKDGNTPLFNACKNGNESLVKYIVEHGADINYKNRNGETHYLKHMKMEIRP